MTKPCPACGGRLERWIAVPGGEPGDEARHELWRCERCGSAVTAGPSPSAAAYESGVYSPTDPRATRLVGLIQRCALRQPASLLHGALPRGARVLDAGAGRGRLVRELTRRGLAAEGIDPALRNVELGAGVVQPGTVERHEDADLDAVVLWHVLEHVEDPAAALARVRTWLRPGGLVLAGVPNVASMQARVAGPKWFHFDAPRHRVHFSAAGLRSLLERSGFELVEERHLVWQHNLHGMWFALLTPLGMAPGFPFHLVKRNIRIRARDVALLALGLPLAPVALALEALAASRRRGGTVAVVARAAQPA